MRFCVLGSGSRGNCTYVGAAGTGVLIDAGFSGVEVERRLASIGVGMEDISAILVTHEHGDHIRGVGVLSRRFKLPVWVNRATLEAAASTLANLHQVRYFKTGSAFEWRQMAIHPFTISHDCHDPVGFVIEAEGRRFGYCTDTGVLSKMVRHRLSSCHGLVLESNHDLIMLKEGPYSQELQQRVRSADGHLANPQALEFLKELEPHIPRKVVLAHISEKNNSRERILSGLAQVSGDKGLEIGLASQERAGDIYCLEGAC